MNQQDRASYREFAMHSLQHALQFWLEADPARPWFHRWFTPSVKLLGDNPDTVYYGTVIDPTRTYRLRGNTANACYTSFTVELGTTGGAMSRSLGHTLNDTEFDIDAAGNFELATWPRRAHVRPPQLAATRPRGRIDHHPPLLRVGALRRPRPRLRRAALDRPPRRPGPPPVPNDAATRPRTSAGPSPPALGHRRLGPHPDAARSDPVGVGQSPTPSPTPADDGDLAIGYAAADNVYRSARWQLSPDEALVITGRFPRCRFANIVLFNNHMQTPNYDQRLRVHSTGCRTMTSHSNTFFFFLFLGVFFWL